MGWTEQETASKATLAVDQEKARLLDKVRKENLPIVQREADNGARPFKTIDFQPVRSPKLFEAEFGVKGDDVIFHFWPWGYHEAERDGRQPPRFKADFEGLLRESLGRTFDSRRTEFSFDADIGAWFVKANGYGLNQFHRNLCIQAAETLHAAMGGKADG